jgi:hypothetical protein
MKKYYVVILLIVISFLIPLNVQAQEDISSSNGAVQINFPSALVFNMTAESKSIITRIRLNYKVEKMNFANVTNEVWPEFNPSTKVDIRWTWDMRKASLPPGAAIKYWWVIENKTGSKLVTQEQTVKFTDNRYPWQTSTSGQITIHWYEGGKSSSDKTMIGSLMATALAALDKLAKDTGAHLEKTADIYIYANSKDLQGSMISPREWTGGVAFTQYSIIAIGISSKELDWGQNAMAHELGHMVTHQLTFSPYGAILPTWLDEGLAMHAESKPDPSLQSWLKKAITNNRTISLKSLSSPFSAKTEEAYISYAQSKSIVEFLIQKFGGGKMLQMLTMLKDGNTCDDALLANYGFNQDGLEDLWLKSFLTANNSGAEDNILSMFTRSHLALPFKLY